MMLRVPSIITRYSFTVLAVTLSTLFRFALDPLLDLRAPFILYFPTVLLCAWFGGLWPGVLSAVLSGLIAWCIFFPPQYSFAVSDPTAPTQLIIFILVDCNS
jgi:two-component system, sensor histidine kinase PdtaS